MLEHGYNALLNHPIHAFCNTVLVRTIGCRVFTSNVAFSEQFDEFIRFELTSIVGLEMSGIVLNRKRISTSVGSTINTRGTAYDSREREEEKRARDSEDERERDDDNNPIYFMKR